MILRELNPQIKKEYKAEIVGFFGSFARGEQRKDSDLDILVQFQEGASLLDFAGLADFLEDELGIKIDLVSKRAIRPELKEQIMAEVVSV
ncbi:nucleotidyltransferase family protein [Methanobacterium petrolearium]|nr:nucleotidyltransferase family protein [Methanobacterium petrolearium]BDZ72125.1 nucleotidyltransferase [Methanobacterium petrolearium]